MDIESNHYGEGGGSSQALKHHESDEHLSKLPRKSYIRQFLSVLVPDALVVAVAVYTLTGVISPTLIDYLSHTYEFDQWALLPVLSTAVGLALVVPLSRLVYHNANVLVVDTGGGRNHDLKTSLSVGGLDLLATSLVTIGLVNVGSATFTVIYSSAAAWTALMSWRNGHPLSGPQILGVFLVTFGLFINGVGHVYEDETRTETGLVIFASSCLCLLIGTILHSLVMVQIDEFTRESKWRALQMASNMGRWEIVALLLWNVVRLTVNAHKQKHEPILNTNNSTISSIPSLFLWFFLLAMNQSFHSLAFFSMIGQLGAVGSAVLKGFLALNTFGLAAALFCEKGHSEQCLTPLKTCSMLFVLFGGIIYGLSSKKKPLLFKNKEKQQQQHVSTNDKVNLLNEQLLLKETLNNNNKMLMV